MIVEAEDRYEVNLADHKVMQCLIDFAFSLDLKHDGQKVLIRIEGPFRLSKGSQTYELFAEDRPGDLGPALELSRTSVNSAVVPTKARPRTAVTFDGTGSRDSDGSVVAWAWDFGDGSVGTGSRATHAYTAAKSTLSATSGARRRRPTTWRRRSRPRAGSAPCS